MGLLFMYPIIFQPYANVYSNTLTKHLWCSSLCVHKPNNPSCNKYMYHNNVIMNNLQCIKKTKVNRKFTYDITKICMVWIR